MNGPYCEYLIHMGGDNEPKFSGDPKYCEHLILMGGDNVIDGPSMTDLVVGLGEPDYLNPS